MPANSASLNEIAYNILNTMRGGRSSQEEYLSIEQIKFAVKYYRSLFIRRDFARNYNRYRMFEQDLGLVDVSLYDTAESSTEESLEQLLRTDSKIPTPIRMKNWEGITFVGGIDKAGKAIPLVGAQRSYWNQFNKYTANEPEAFYREGHVYLRNEKDLDVINIRGVFEDPEKVFEFTSFNDIDVYSGDEPFPISMDMLQNITQALIKGELSVAIQTTNDTELDNLQDTQPHK